MKEFVFSNWAPMLEFVFYLDELGIMYDVIENKQGFFEYWVVVVDYVKFSIV